MIQLLLLAVWPATPELRDAQALRSRLERALQGFPLHGPRFRKRVAEVAAEFTKDPAEFAHPWGKPDSTLLTFENGPVNDDPIYVVFRHKGKLHVEPILLPQDYEGEGQDPYRILQAAWSNGRLFTLLRWEGASGNSDYGRVFAFQHGRWRMTQRLNAYGENAREGELNRRRVVSRAPLSIFDTFLVRYPVDDERPHGGVYLNYRETWRFTGGLLRRTSLRRIQTPYATLCDIFKAVERRQRGRFDALVAPSLRNRIWRLLPKLRHTADGFDPNDRDETPNLEIGRQVKVTFRRHRGRWVLTHVEPISN